MPSGGSSSRLSKSIAVSFIARDGMSGVLRRMGRNMVYFQSSMNSVMMIVGGFVAGGTLIALGSQIAKLGTDSVKAAAEFETAFTGVLKTTENLVDDATGKLTAMGENVREDLRQTAKEIPTTVVELSKMAEIGGQLGIADAAIVDFTKVIADMAVSTNLTAEEAATSLARMASIFDVSSKDMGEYMKSAGAAVVALGNNFATTEKEILQSSMRLAGTGKALGLTEADVLGISTALSSLGIQSRLGTTAVQKALLQMNEVAGATSDGFIDNSRAIRKTSDTLTSYATKLESVELKAGKTMEEMLSLRDSFVASGGSVDAFASTLSSSEQALLDSATNIESLQKQLGYLESRQGKGVDLGALEEFARVSGMTADEFKKTWGTEGGQIKILQRFVEGLQKPGEDAAQILEKLGINNQQQIRTFLALAGAGDKLSQAISMSNVEWGKQTALVTEAGRRYKTFESQLQILRNKVNDIKITIGDALIPSLIDLKNAIEPVIDKIGESLLKAVQEKAAPALESLANMINDVSSGSSSGLKEMFALPPDIAQPLNDIWQALKDIWQVMVDAGIADFFMEIGASLMEFVGSVLKETISEIADVISSVSEYFNENKDELADYLDTVSSVTTFVIDVLKDGLNSIISIIGGLSEAWMGFWTMIGNLKEDPTKALKTYYVELGVIGTDVLNDLNKAGEDLMNRDGKSQLEKDLERANFLVDKYRKLVANTSLAEDRTLRRKLTMLEHERDRIASQLAIQRQLEISNETMLGSMKEIAYITSDYSVYLGDSLATIDEINSSLSTTLTMQRDLRNQDTGASGGEVDIPVPTNDEADKAAQEFASMLASAIQNAMQPTLDEVWKSPNDSQRIDEWARRLATLTTDGLDSEWIPALEGQFGGTDWWKPIGDAIASGDSSALNGLVTNMLTDNVTQLWDKEVIKNKVREALIQDQLKATLAKEIADELSSEGGLDVSQTKVNELLGVSPTAESLVNGLSSGLPVAMKDAGVSGTMVDSLISDLENEEKRMEKLAETFANGFAEALPDAMGQSGEAFVDSVAHSVAIKLGLEYEE